MSWVGLATGLAMWHCIKTAKKRAYTKIFLLYYSPSCLKFCKDCVLNSIAEWYDILTKGPYKHRVKKHFFHRMNYEENNIYSYF